MDVLTTVLYILCTTIQLFIGFLQTAMYLRALLSWFPIGEDNPLNRFLFAVTEPAIMPVRALLARFGVGEDSPIDIGFFVTMLVLLVVGILLPSVPLPT